MTGSPQFDTLDAQTREAVEFIVISCLDVCYAQTDWYRNLGAKEAEYLRIILLTAVTDYVEYTRTHALDKTHHEHISADNLFNLAPLETTFEITLENVIDAIRIVVDIIEDHIELFAPAGQEAAYVRAAMYFWTSCSYTKYLGYTR